MDFTQVKETCIYVSDLERTKKFYTEVLKLPIISIREGRHIFFRVGTSVLLCFIPEATKNEDKLPPHYGYGQIHFAIEVDTREKYEYWKNRVAKFVNIEHEEEWRNGLKSFYFRDPDGNLVEIVEKGIWG